MKSQILLVFIHIYADMEGKCTWMHLIKTGVGYQIFPESWRSAPQHHPTPLLSIFVYYVTFFFSMSILK